MCDRVTRVGGWGFTKEEVVYRDPEDNNDTENIMMMINISECLLCAKYYLSALCVLINSILTKSL